MSEARTGMTAATLARLFAMYAKDNPDAIVRFTSCERGGYWPKDRREMSLFTDHQITLIDETRVGGTMKLGVSLIAFEESGIT